MAWLQVYRYFKIFFDFSGKFILKFWGLFTPFQGHLGIHPDKVVKGSRKNLIKTFGSSLQIEHELPLEVPNKVPFPIDTYLELQLDAVTKLSLASFCEIMHLDVFFSKTW